MVEAALSASHFVDFQVCLGQLGDERVACRCLLRALGQVLLLREVAVAAPGLLERADLLEEERVEAGPGSRELVRRLAGFACRRLRFPVHFWLIFIKIILLRC